MIGSKMMFQRLFKSKRKDSVDEAINVVNSISQAKRLYKKLALECHPDKFALDKEKYDLATDIFQRLSDNKYNYKVLTELDSEIQQLLK